MLTKPQIDLLTLISKQDGSAQMRIPQTQVRWVLERDGYATFHRCAPHMYYARMTVAGINELEKYSNGK